MSKKAIRSIILLMCISLIGIVAFQVYWIKNTIDFERNNFNKEVQTALINISDNAIKQEAKLLVKKHIPKKIKKKVSPIREEIKVIVGENDELLSGKVGKTIVINSQEGETTIIKTSGTTITTTSTTTTVEGINEKYQSSKDLFIEVADELAYEYAFNKLSLAERLKNVNLDSLLNSQFKNIGLENLEYNFSVIDNSNDSLIAELGSESDFENAKTYTAAYTNEGSLKFQVKDEIYPILKSLSSTLALSLLLTIILIGTFIYTINSILKQKRISKMKADFINNMTHEFKTPVATISLAIDSILHPDVIQKPEEIEKMGVVIKKENTRMNTQIESLLGIAQFDREEVELNFEKVDTHLLIAEIKDNFEMKTKAAKGDLALFLNAESHMVRIDKMHLYNCIRNLIDNGIKYSSSDFRIKVNTSNESNYLSIKIADQGIGMNANTQKRVFDRFYRKTTGNIHSTKGFGLGLAYVKEILAKLNSEIKVESEYGKGSTFTIKIPIIK